MSRKLLESVRMRANQTGEGGPLLETEGRSALARWSAIIGWWAMLVFAFHACTHMVAAGDTWVAMACGRHFVNHDVDTVEPFSANSHAAGPTLEEIKHWPTLAKLLVDVEPEAIGLDMDQVKQEHSWLLRALIPKFDLETVRYWHPTGWINQNWLTHEIFYKLTTTSLLPDAVALVQRLTHVTLSETTTTAGSEQEPYFDALIVWKFVIYVLAIICIYYTARLLGVHPALAAVASGFALFIGRSFIDVRPAGFSNLLVAAFILILALTSYRNARYIWLVVPLVAFWSNVHGGYLYAFIMLVAFVGWHLVLRLPKRWMIATYSILTWIVLYGLAHQFGQHEYLTPDPDKGDWMAYMLLLAIAGSLVLAWDRRVSESVLNAAHITTSCVVFLLLLVRFFPALPENLNQQGRRIFAEYAASGRLAYIGIFSLALILGVVVVALKEKMVRVLEWRALGHAVGAGAVAFVAMVIFNPFHLTNLTHTFTISFSEHAERWRDVHEWHRAFDWTNPVGTAIPFLTMYTLAWLALIVWAVVSLRTAHAADQPGKKRPPWAGSFTWLKMDLALVVVAAMTVYMAIRSRRFIPIAAFVACPVVALLIQQIVACLLARRHPGRAAPNVQASPGEALERVVILGLGGALVVLGFWRLVFWPWLFLPVPGHPTLIQPRYWLMAPGIVLAFAALPLLAVFYLSGDRMGTSRRSFVERAWWAAAWASSASALGFGVWTGLTFKLVYLDYWPADPELTSIFMRMTASDAKPFKVCQFMRQNQLSGKMFNYWTEGGFIAWGQDPDPNTGKTPLQLFMDGRAQAAYNRDTFDLWTRIIGGGPTATRAAIARRRPNAREYAEIGNWVTEQLDKYGVWVVLMPNNQFDKAFVSGLVYSLDWRVVFVNNKQKLFVNIRSAQGRDLFEGMFSGATKYPDEFSANLSIGHNLLLFKDPVQKKQGLDRIMKAFELNPSPAPILDLLIVAVQFPELRGPIDEFCVGYTTAFEQNRDQYAGHDGYNLRLEAARLALLRLEQVAQVQGKTEAAQTCADRMRQYVVERDDISMRKRW